MIGFVVGIPHKMQQLSKNYVPLLQKSDIYQS